MKQMEKDWYKKIWTLDIQNMSWVEDTKRQVDFIIDKLDLKGTERILDLACGFGRHSLEFARRGYEVVGVDITKDYVEYANEQAGKEQLEASFICKDIRELTFENEFDVALNMADGAIGYLEDDEENKKIFAVVAKARFPCKLWDAGEQCLTLSEFEWDRENKTLLYGQIDYTYGEALSKPEMKEGNPIRLYTLGEVSDIFMGLGMNVCETYADFTGRPASDNDIQMMVYSRLG